ncbi:fibronectin type III domain-containing protein [Aetokthonos hydrillicola Thurmond2011]|jgi:hypothetical protein|uniref:Fibronectin type III domain-containing protein n=1 Tax=Aetokthonos hydrillicola Thurmond2011 TaxID=2712845 RepID=A0AAP5I682_9CYAN|nr:fibronectin type III domain-containing protein [Aetokthonos hydrillicola]MBO3463113.1 fibronectin type III domain-containing protein [Aetokthonos hydrillicola CCALA 1050]MBW4591103.1 fibronectin type III domain-containing protein [Aetokthonos hydrillicola CCALA 1050]MDR9893235.1 fibronectin type III domain-containing protein [Aetokthonos hydrillicola Thurmond2011]
MVKKSGLGRQDDFSKNSKIPQVPKLSQLREGDRASFILRPDNSLLPHLPCDGIQINDNPDLRITGKGGRQVGENILYDPAQELNYRSQYQRYLRSLWYAPSYTEEKNNKITYFFCSSSSPTGYWEVVVGGGGTYLNFAPPVLTIICPRPFNLQDYVALDTDGESIAWSQQQGRTTIISPAGGNGSLNPTIVIVGTRSPLDPPILLLAELEDNTSVFNYLLIRTTVAEIVDGMSGMESGLVVDGGPQLTIPCSFAPIPGTPNTAFTWSSGTIEITWNPPPSHSSWITEYRLQQDIDGSYQTVQSISPTNRRATVGLGNYYRILTIFNVLGRGYSATESCRIRFSSNPPYVVLGCDRVNGQSGMDGKLTVTQYPLSVVNYFVPKDEINGQSGMDGKLTVTQYPLSVVNYFIPKDEINGQSGMDGKFVTTIYNLTGGIVG